MLQKINCDKRLWNEEKKIVVYEVPKKSVNFGLTRVFFIENSSFLKSKILNFSWNADKILKQKAKGWS